MNLKFPINCKSVFSALGLMFIPCFSLNATLCDNSRWIEADSAKAIKSRLLSDFSLTFDEAVEQIGKTYCADAAAHAREFADKHYIETKVIDGVERVHRKSVRNLALLNPEMNNGWSNRGSGASAERIAEASTVFELSKGDGQTEATGGKGGLKRKVHFRFSIDVPYDASLKSDTLRVWMPMPFESARQGNVKIISTSQPDYIISGLDRSVHNTIYMEQPVVEGKDTHFDFEGEFTAYGQFFDPEYILANMRDYDKNSELYKKYTAFEAPHIVRLDSLAHAIVGSETNPFRQSELVYDWIVSQYPWAGAREYSTLDCIPLYVLEEKHGDCGQVSLLYISLLRSLGVPVRWESGWVTPEGEENLHDWAEVYFEGIGWVPVDVSYGRMTNVDNKKLRNFYSTGQDVFRMSTNKGVCGELFPAKKFVRSETVDFQLGEVECSKGNLFYPMWKKRFEILK